ncbi:MAG: hypothetical protein AUH10_04325 [Gammaproteobacteria bacterium 13_2_20CM_66_19]|nr:MAG: hypothetical protein AUH10_04325 [Gammaproteobacteria bacterium 13_2_20CM_66_19]
MSEIIGRDAVDVRLDELADLLRARHARDKCLDAALEIRIARQRRLEPRPALRMHRLRGGSLRRAPERRVEEAQRPEVRRAIVRDAARSHLRADS